MTFTVFSASYDTISESYISDNIIAPLATVFVLTYKATNNQKIVCGL